MPSLRARSAPAVQVPWIGRRTWCGTRSAGRRIALPVSLDQLRIVTVAVEDYAFTFGQPRQVIEVTLVVVLANDLKLHVVGHRANQIIDSLVWQETADEQNVVSRFDRWRGGKLLRIDAAQDDVRARIVFVSPRSFGCIR